MKDNFDLESMDKSELLKLQKKIEVAIREKEQHSRAAALKAAEAAAAKFGYSLKDLMEDAFFKKAGKPKANPGTPKYVNPENPLETWTGKGRRPQWFLKAIESGKSAESLAIN